MTSDDSLIIELLESVKDIDASEGVFGASILV
jgi:hypothetical protein